MGQILTVDHANRERAAGPARHTMILGNHCEMTTLIAQDHETDGTPPEPPPGPGPPDRPAPRDSVVITGNI